MCWAGASSAWTTASMGFELLAHGTCKSPPRRREGPVGAFAVCRFHGRPLELLSRYPLNRAPVDAGSEFAIMSWSQLCQMICFLLAGFL